MSELEPRKVVGAGLLAAGFCLIVLAAFAAAPRAAWAQKDKDQYGDEKPAAVAAKAACTPLYIGANQTPKALAESVQDHINSKCDVAYPFSTAKHDVHMFVCCVPK